MFRSFLPSSLPPFSRRNYRYELRGVTAWPIVAIMIDGSVTGILAKKGFPDTPDWIIAALAAAPAISNMSSLIWARLADGQRTIRHLNLLQLGVIALVAFIATLPGNHIGLLLFTAAAMLSRLLMTGIITLRAVLWRANYARAVRSSITGRLITVQTIIGSCTALLLGSVMDLDANSFHAIYALGSLAGLIGVYCFSRIRVRHPWHIRPGIAPRRQPPGFSLTGLAGEWGSTLGEMLHIMRTDLAYRGYLVCMFILGMSNLAMDGPLIKVVTEHFHLNYLASILLLQALPLILIPLTIPVWARLMKHWHIIRFRAIQGWAFVIALILLFFAIRRESIPLLTACLLARGLGASGGALAWNLGHNDFAPPEQASLYMAMHVTLTGVRGLFAASLGMLLYAGYTWHGISHPLLGEYSFLLWAGTCTLGVLGFVYLNFRLRHVVTARAHND